MLDVANLTNDGGTIEGTGLLNGSPVPIPSGLLLLAPGLLALMGMRKRLMA